MSSADIKEELKSQLVQAEKRAVDVSGPGKPPVKFCGQCGRRVKHVWFNEKLEFLNRGEAGMEIPGWNQVPCECSRASSADGEAVFLGRMRRAGIGRRYLEKDFEDYVADLEEQAEVLELARDFAVNFETAMKRGTWLFFVGNPGTGKTMLSCAIARNVMRGGYSVLYVKAREIFRRIKESWRRDSDERESEILNDLKTVDLLIIDELGVQFGSEAERGILYDVLDGRYEDMKPLIATTNRDFGELAVIMGEHNLDRFRDSSSDSRIVVFDWGSRRSGEADE